MPEAGAPRLDELPEARATGEAARIYGEIRRLSAVPMVALIYRHLATMPGVLEWSWALLEPAMRAGAVQEAAWELARGAALPRQGAIPSAALRAAGVGAEDERGIANVLDAYNRANPVNIVVVRCLALHLGEARVAGTAAGERWPAWQPPAAIGALPPIVDPAEMTPAVRELAILLANRGPTDSPAPLWPSLYRHLAHWPAFLGYASVLLAPAFDEVDVAATRFREQADAAAARIAAQLTPPRELERPSGAQAQQLRAAIDAFSQRIPEMVVIGNTLRRALPIRSDT
jgi:hypothetical protein